MSSAITDAITTIALAETRFNLSLTEDGAFFPEWQSDLLSLSSHEKKSLDELRQRYLYQRSAGQLLEGTVTLLLVSPLLAIAGFYDPPLRVRAVEKANQSNFVALDELNQLRDNNYREFVDNLGLFPLIYKLQFDSYRDHRGPKRQFHRWRHKETRLHPLYN